MPTRIKICGITRREDAELAVELGAAALGFNFYRPSPRYIAPAAARVIIRELPAFVTTVGVFADETDVERVASVAAEAGVSAVQVDESLLSSAANGLGSLGRFQVIATVRVTPGSKAGKATALGIRTVLLDTYRPDRRGGTGQPFDWSFAREATRYQRVILAGGLTSENVGDAIRAVRPYAVDVASGVESAPGVKDEARLRAFFTAVDEADRHA